VFCFSFFFIIYFYHFFFLSKKKEKICIPDVVVITILWLGIIIFIFCQLF